MYGIRKFTTETSQRCLVKMDRSAPPGLVVRLFDQPFVQYVLNPETYTALHGKFTAVVYRGKAYHGYTVVASYHIPYRLKTVQFSENRTISTIYHFVPYYLEKTQVDPVPYDDVENSDLCGEVQTAVDVCVEYMGKKNLGEVGNPVEHISTLLDPRLKTLSKQECVNGSPDVKQLATNELKDVADLFEGPAPQQTTVPAASASALPPPLRQH